MKIQKYKTKLSGACRSGGFRAQICGFLQSAESTLFGFQTDSTPMQPRLAVGNGTKDC